MTPVRAGQLLFAVSALALAAVGGAAQVAAAPAAGPATAPPTPRTSDGHPDLTGLWRRPPPPADANVNVGRFTVGVTSVYTGGSSFLVIRDGDEDYLEIDGEFMTKSDQDMPEYRPEYWDKIRDLEEYAYRRPADPAYGCREPGVVRLGEPEEIVELPGKVILIYTGEHLWMREIPTDGRPLPKPDDYEGTKIAGTSSAHWDGDTLVIETVDFPPDLIWYSSRGWIGSPEAKITERFTRAGDALTLSTTVDDPMFVHPWTLRPERLLLNRAKAALLQQPLPCEDHDGPQLPPSSK